MVMKLRRPRQAFVTPVDEATFATLHTISQASPSLRGGLTRESARRSARHLRTLLGVEAIAFTDLSGLLVWEGTGSDHGAFDHARSALASGRPGVVRLDCPDADCPVQVAMVAPLNIEGRVVGALIAYGEAASPARTRALAVVARWVSCQLELAELDSSRARLADAELRALRAQISPHFVYNSLTTIASFVRTDPERARELLLDFADFARYSFRTPREFTTLSDELKSIHRYVQLETARFGARLQFSVDVAPEVLPVAVPFLSLQPLVENSIRHGMEAGREAFRVSIVARDVGVEAAISVEDDGVGMEPDHLRSVLAGTAGPHTGIGLANVDERLRHVYGDEYGLVVETAPGAGTRINLRVPKYRPGIYPELHTGIHCAQRVMEGMVGTCSMCSPSMTRSPPLRNSSTSCGRT
jgi:two-component system LytT family sensor kinase